MAQAATRILNEQEAQMQIENYRADDVATVEEFLNRYYKPERYTGRGEEYADVLLASYQREFDERGHTAISRHDSINGRVCEFRGI